MGQSLSRNIGETLQKRHGIGRSFGGSVRVFFVCVCVYVFVCMFVCLFVCLCDGGHKRGVVRVRERAVTHVWIDVVSFFVDF